MLQTHTTPIELCGEDYDAEIEYEWEDGSPVLYGVEIVKPLCKPGDSRYDERGLLQHGPAWVRVGITDLLSEQQIRQFTAEIATYEQERASDFDLDRCTLRAIARWNFTKRHGPFDAYPGHPVA